MYVTLHTMAYASERSGIDEVAKVASQVGGVYGPKFLDELLTDPKSINDTIRENINLIMPEEGWKVSRLIEIATEEGVNYQPTEKSLAVSKIPSRSIGL